MPGGDVVIKRAPMPGDAEFPDLINGGITDSLSTYYRRTSFTDADIWGGGAESCLYRSAMKTWASGGICGNILTTGLTSEEYNRYS